MKPQSIKRLFTIGTITCSLLVITFSILSIMNIENWLLRILTQGSLGLSTLLDGIRETIYENKKKLGRFKIAISVFLFCAMFFTIYVAFKIDAF